MVRVGRVVSRRPQQLTLIYLSLERAALDKMPLFY